jgi:hypothetical protein
MWFEHCEADGMTIQNRPQDRILPSSESAFQQNCHPSSQNDDHQNQDSSCEWARGGRARKQLLKQPGALPTKLPQRHCNQATPTDLLMKHLRIPQLRNTKTRFSHHGASSHKFPGGALNGLSTREGNPRSWNSFLRETAHPATLLGPSPPSARSVCSGRTLCESSELHPQFTTTARARIGGRSASIGVNDWYKPWRTLQNSIPEV